MQYSIAEQSGAAVCLRVPAIGTERTNDRTPPATQGAKRLLQMLESLFLWAAPDGEATAPGHELGETRSKESVKVRPAWPSGVAGGRQLP